MTSLSLLAGRTVTLLAHLIMILQKTKENQDTIGVSNSLDPDQVRNFFWSKLFAEVLSIHHLQGTGD